MKFVQDLIRMLNFEKMKKHVMNARRADVIRVILLCVLGIALMILIRIAGGSVCFIKSVFGVPCPACGMSRAWMSVVRGDFAGAFILHPLFPLPVIIAGMFIFIPRIRHYRQSAALWAPVILLFISVYALRMFFYFPHIPPLDFNHHAILVRLGRMILSVMT